MVGEPCDDLAQCDDERHQPFAQLVARRLRRLDRTGTDVDHAIAIVAHDD
jgi:hypothetical protein